MPAAPSPPSAHLLPPAMPEPKRKRNWAAFLTGAAAEAEADHETGSGPPADPSGAGAPSPDSGWSMKRSPRQASARSGRQAQPAGSPSGSVTAAPRFPEPGRRRPITRVARPVSSAPPPATEAPVMVAPDGTPAVQAAVPDHLSPPGEVRVAGIDVEGVEWVWEDDPEAAPLVDPRYDEIDRNWTRYRTGWGGFLRFAAFVVLAIWAFFWARSWVYGWVDRQIEPEGGPGEIVDFTIAEGASTNQVATELENAGIIGNSTVFRYWLRCEGELDWQFLNCQNDKVFLAGDYQLNQNLSFEAVVAALDTGPVPVQYSRFLIPEGLRLNETVERLLAVNPSFDRAELLAAMESPDLVSEHTPPNVAVDKRLEGTLFPSTYEIADDDLADEAQFLKLMATTFDDRFRSLMAELGRDPIVDELGLSNYDVIIIASLIEEEAQTDVDRPKMARAIYNRLRDGNLLQIDASVIYGLGKSFTDTIYQSDLDSDTPYNTHRYSGLPPTPIAAPGEKALTAALAPAAGDWKFWVRTDEGGEEGAHTFSVTNEEHNRAVAVCRELGYCG